MMMIMVMTGEVAVEMMKACEWWFASLSYTFIPRDGVSDRCMNACRKHSLATKAF